MDAVRAHLELQTAADTFSRLLGLRMAARLEPDVAEQAVERMARLLAVLTQDEWELVMVAALDYAADLYVMRNPEQAHRQADNIARALRDAHDYGAGS